VAGQQLLPFHFHFVASGYHACVLSREHVRLRGVLVIAGLFILLVSGRKHPLLMELRDDTIYYTYSTRWNVVDVEMKTDTIKIELYNNKYYVPSISNDDTRSYLYFTSLKDESVYLELKESFYTLGQILSELERSEKVLLGNRELKYVARYRAQVEKDRTPLGRAMNILIPLLILSVLGLSFIRLSGIF
jgi:hypothetical protein